MALSLDGASWVRVADSESLDLIGPLTIECWVKPAVLGADINVLSKWGHLPVGDRSYEILLRDHHRVGFPLSTDGTQNNGAFHNFDAGLLVANTWQHIACTFDGTTRRTYINGSLAGVKVAPGAVHVGVTDLAIGAFLSGNDEPATRFLNGLVDEVRIWSVERGQAEILATMNETIDAGEVSRYVGLVSVWSFEGNATDATGLNDGILQGQPAFVVAADQPVMTQATWADIGGAHAGAGGLPQLFATGTLTAGSLNQLDLWNAAPSAASTLVVGLSQIGAPFKGGVMVPAPDLLLVQTSSASGALSTPFTWPSGAPSGSVLYMQYWVSDGSASHGLAASNAIQATTP